MLECRIHAHHLRVRFRLKETRVTVAGAALDTAAAPRLLLVEHDPERHVERLQPGAREVAAELLHAWLVRDRRMRIGSTRRRIRGVLAALSVHLIETLGFGVVRLEIGVRDRPGW